MICCLLAERRAISIVGMLMFILGCADPSKPPDELPNILSTQNESSFLEYVNSNNIDLNDPMTGIRRLNGSDLPMLPIGFLVSEDNCRANFLQRLIDLGADPERVIGSTTTLRLALFSGSDECISMLIDQGVSIRGSAMSGHTALHAALIRGNLDFVVRIATLWPEAIRLEGKDGVSPMDIALYMEL